MTFYFYDLETSGFRSRTDRIIQFGGQRTDLNLNPLSEPDNILIKLSEDVLPEPDAVLVHGITPQTARADGVNEAEFGRFLTGQAATADTIFVGYNNIRFDDEFIRFTLWRNFYDAYEWQWQGGTSRWDLLDLTRLTRALRPEGINWPVDVDGKSSNRLELLAAVNKLDHTAAHDALSDVRAVMAMARLIRAKQPKLFDYLLRLRDKNKVRALVERGDPLVYTSGRYPSEFEKTTVAVMITPTEDGRGALMYDLRTDPEPFLKLDATELAAKWQALWNARGRRAGSNEPIPPGQDRSEEREYFPVKILGYNRNPALAPLTVLDKSSQQRLKLNMLSIQKNLKAVKESRDLSQKLLEAVKIMYPPAGQVEMVVDEQRVDELLYEGFVSKADKIKMSAVRAADKDTIAKLAVDFDDERLKLLLPLYKARNFPSASTPQERQAWENFKYKRLLDGGPQSSAARYFKRIDELTKRPGLSEQDKHLLEELKLYGQSVVPASAQSGAQF